MDVTEALLDTITIDAALVRRLIDAQFPQWAQLPIRPVAHSGWDNRTFHLGDTMLVRLPSAARYVAQVEKEQRWLPWLAPQLPLPIPAPVAMGAASAEFPARWSVYRWIAGEHAVAERIADLRAFAIDLAQFLRALWVIDPTAGPLPGAHNFYRGGALTIYDDETRRSIAILCDEVPVEALTQLWQAALDSTWNGVPVWVHGDVAVGNLLVSDGQLCAVIDFGSSAVGDPACDLVIAWTLFAGESRDAFLAVLAQDAGTRARARGWALWKALITVVEHRSGNSSVADSARSVIAAVLADYQQYR